MDRFQVDAGSLYKKLLPGGKLDHKGITQADYDLSVQYIKKCFPKATKLQKDIEQTLKRTFVLGESEPKRKYLTKRRHRPPKTGSTRKQRLRKERTIPRRLDYNLFVPLNEMWKAYIADLLQNEERPEEIQLKLNRVDLHGAHITVSQAHCTDYLGIQGIIIKETKNALYIVSQTGNTKLIPKAENVFDVNIDSPKGKLRICGNSFITRPADRASKKIKSFMEYIGARVYKSKLRYTYPK